MAPQDSHKDKGSSTFFNFQKMFLKPLLTTRKLFDPYLCLILLIAHLKKSIGIYTNLWILFTIVPIQKVEILKSEISTHLKTVELQEIDNFSKFFGRRAEKKYSDFQRCTAEISQRRVTTFPLRWPETVKRLCHVISNKFSLNKRLLLSCQNLIGTWFYSSEFSHISLEIPY